MTTKARRTPREKPEISNPKFSATDGTQTEHGLESVFNPCSIRGYFEFRISNFLLSLCSLCLCGELVLPPAARAEHASIDLRIMRVDAQAMKEKDEVSASVLQEPPGEIVDQRPVFKAKAGEPLVLQFILKNTYPHGEKKDVRVRYFLVREAKPKQKNVPDLREGVVTEGRFTLNYKPQCRVGARQAFTIKEPGNYLLRVQTENTDSDHEHFSAIDIQVEK